MLSPTQKSVRVKVWIGLALCTLSLVAIAVAWEVLYIRRNKLLRSIGSMVGSHLVASRQAAMEGNFSGALDVQFLEKAMNNGVHDMDKNKAKEDLESMYAMVVNAKRNNFLLPLITKEISQVVIKWSTSATEAGEVALKVLPFVMERHAQHMDQMIAQSYVIISDNDPKKATHSMRSLAHQLDMANAAGLSVDPRMVLFNPNKTTVKLWAQQEELPQPQAAARGLLDSIMEAIQIRVQNLASNASPNTNDDSTLAAEYAVN